MRKVLGFFALLFLLNCNGGCQPVHAPTVPDGESAPAAVGAFGLGDVSAQGTCNGTVSMDLTIGPLLVPVVVRADTSADADGRADGTVSLDVGGLLTARCLISRAKPKGLCAVGGLAPRLMTSPSEAQGDMP